MSKVSDFIDPSSSIDLERKIEKLQYSYGEILQLLYDNSPEFADLIDGLKISEVSSFGCANFNFLLQKNYL